MLTLDHHHPLIAMNDQPIEVSSDDETPYTDSRSSLGKGHPSRASQREAMNAGRAAASSSKQTPPKATKTKASKASSSSKGKRKRNDSDDDSEFEGKKSKSSAPRRKFPPFEKWEDDVFVEAILANYTPDHQVSAQSGVAAAALTFSSLGRLQRDRCSTSRAWPATTRPLQAGEGVVRR